jgi:hypothetical protein
MFLFQCLYLRCFQHALIQARPSLTRRCLDITITFDNGFEPSKDLTVLVDVDRKVTVLDHRNGQTLRWLMNPNMYLPVVTRLLRYLTSLQRFVAEIDSHCGILSAS